MARDQQTIDWDRIYFEVLEGADVRRRILLMPLELREPAFERYKIAMCLVHDLAKRPDDWDDKARAAGAILYLHGYELLPNLSRDDETALMALALAVSEYEQRK